MPDLHRLRRYWPHALLGSIVLIFAGRTLLVKSSEEGLVLETLRGVLSAANVREDELPGSRDRRVQVVLREGFTDPVTVRHADLPRTGAGQRALLVWARLLQRYQAAELSILHASVALHGEGRATAQLDVELSARDSGAVRRDERAVKVSLVWERERWLIEAVDVAPAAANQPEARP